VSLQDILEAIRAVGDAQVGEIQAQARIQVHEIQATTRMEAEEIEEAACNASTAPAAKERARILHRARLEAMQIVGQARDGLVDTTLERTRAILGGLRSDRSYPDILCRLTEEALKELTSSLDDGEKIQLALDERDQAPMVSLLRHLVLDLDVSYDLNCWGGLVARSQDGQITVNNTLDTRLERALPYLRRYLAAWFEDEQWPISTTETPVYAQ
jgi:vacuolar-type H+-ATPase subunit E/Vma4